MDNTSPDGGLDTDLFQSAMLQFRNTPDRDTKLSPAVCVFGRPIRDFIPIPRGRYQPHNTWSETLLEQENALGNSTFKRQNVFLSILNDSHPFLLETMSASKIKLEDIL